MNSSVKNHMEHGGHVRRGRRKLARPLSKRHPLRLKLQSARARGAWALDRSRNRSTLLRLLTRCARKWRVRVIELRVLPDRLELTVRFRSDLEFRSFLREFPGRLALAITQASKGRAQGRFWAFTAYSCILWMGLRLSRSWRQSQFSRGLQRLSLTLSTRRVDSS
jgi:hypothetical protein